MLLRPKTGLKDMVAELDAGHAPPPAGCPRAARSRSRQTLPDVNLDEILASLDADTRDYLTILLSAGGQGARRRRRARWRDAIRRFEPTARYGAQGQRARSRRASTTSSASIHNFSLLIGRARRQGRPGRRVRRELERRVRHARRARTPNLRATLRELPTALQATQSGARQGAARSPTSSARRCRRCGRARARSGRRCAACARSCARRRRSSTTRCARSCAPRGRRSRELRPTLQATSRPRRPTSRGRSRSSTRCSTSSPTTRRASEEGYLFWLAWANHIGNHDLHHAGRARPDPPRPRSSPAARTLAVLEQVAAANPLLGTLTELLNCRRPQECPTSTAGAVRSGRLMQKAAPSFGRIAVDGRRSRCRASACCCSCGWRSAARSR